MRRVLTKGEKTTVYPELFKRVFGYEADPLPPQTVFVYENDDTGEIESFLSCYKINHNTLYCAHVGTVDQQQGNSWQLDLLYNYVYDKGIRWLQANVENTNVVCQRMLLTKGWLPHGVKVTQGKIFIEYFANLEEII